jgi:hypothetical protein
MQQRDKPQNLSPETANSRSEAAATSEHKHQPNPETRVTSAENTPQGAKTALAEEDAGFIDDELEVDSEAEEAMHSEYEKSVNREEPLDYQPPSPPPYKEPHNLHSFGKFGTIMLEVEPKRPIKFLEGKESSQMKEILGRGYGSDDWYER